ncbi:MAG: RDD family protein [Nitrososphaerales archaeon]
MVTSEEDKPEIFEFLDVLRQKIRVRIVTLLYENVEMSYTELLNILNIDEGLLNFHLRKIKKFIQITEARTYMLSEYGKMAYEVLHEIDKKTRSYQSNAANLLLEKGVLTGGIVLRRIAAFLLDALILFLSTGLFLDRNVLQILTDLSLFRFPNFSVVQLSYETVSIYSNIFFAAYVIFTILEAYKGQTMGKYLAGLRVVKCDGRRLSLIDSAVRNLGKVFFLPLDLIFGIALHKKDGYIRFFDYYTKSTVVRVSTP